MAKKNESANSQHNAESQADRFKSAARRLGADESEETFNANLKKVASHRPPLVSSKPQKPKK